MYNLLCIKFWSAKLVPGQKFVIPCTNLFLFFHLLIDIYGRGQEGVLGCGQTPNRQTDGQTNYILPGARGQGAPITEAYQAFSFNSTSPYCIFRISHCLWLSVLWPQHHSRPFTALQDHPIRLAACPFSCLPRPFLTRTTSGFATRSLQNYPPPV